MVIIFSSQIIVGPRPHKLLHRSSDRDHEFELVEKMSNLANDGFGGKVGGSSTTTRKHGFLGEF
jgi:hypothetical protein